MRITGPDFVGREHEMSALTRTLSDSPAVALVVGEAGIGKSRLVREFLAAQANAGRVMPVAVCPPFQESLTLGPIVDALRTATTEVRELPLSALAGALRPLFPEWADHLPGVPEPLWDATAARHRLFRALAELITALDVAVLVVEDVHWADEATLEFLLFLTSGRSTGPALLLTYRPEETPPGLLRLSSRLPGGSTRITVEPLDVAATARLASSMLGGEHISTAFATFLHERTDGIPLAVEEVVRLMHDRADLARRNGEWVRRHLDQIVVPATIRDAVLERAERLGADARTVLRAAAVLADPAEEPALVAIAGLPLEQALAGLTEVVGSGLLQEDSRGLLAFRNALNCRAVYESIPARQRRAMHLRAGRTLEAVKPPPLARLARHFREAGDLTAWLRYAELAADLAAASGDEAAAGALLHDLVTNASLPASTVAKLTDKIPYASFVGLARFQDLARALRSVLAAGVADRRDEAEVRFQLGRLLTMVQDYDAGRLELQRAVPDLGHQPVMAVRSLLTLAWPRGASWTAEMHRQVLRRATEMMPRLPGPERIRATVDRTSALLLLGDERGWAEARRLPEAPAAGLEGAEITRGHANTADFAVKWGCYAQARRSLATAIRLTSSQQYLHFHDGLLITQLHLDYFTGAWNRLAERARALVGGEDSQQVNREELILVLGLLHLATGARAEGQRHLSSALRVVGQHGAIECVMEPAAALARSYLAEDRVADALGVTEEPMEIVRRKGIWLWASDLGPARVAALVAAGRLPEATGLVAEFAAGLAECTAPAANAGLRTARAILLDGQREPAAGAFAEAAQAWARLPRPYEALLARERQAGCLLAGGQAEAGRTLLAEVFHELSGLGARGDAVRVMYRLRQHGVEVRRPWWGGSRGYGERLSPRELDVARLLVSGRTNRDIAQELYLSPKTVARHVQSAMRKLDVSTRTALAVRLIEEGHVAQADFENGSSAQS